MVSVVHCLACLVLATTIKDVEGPQKPDGDDDYTDICDNYNTDKPNDNCVDFVAEFTLRQVDKWNIVAENNRWRNYVAQGREKRGYLGDRPSSSNMIELNWDDELEALAELWTYNCKREHDFAACRTVANQRGVGEIYSVTRFKGGRPMSVKERVETWYDSVDQLTTANYHEFEKNYRSKVEWVVMVWADADTIGCSRAVYRKKTMLEVWWCFYGHANHDEVSPSVYMEGAPCSKCPPNYKCSQRYPCLCDGQPEGDGSSIGPNEQTHRVCNDTRKFKCKKVAIDGASTVRAPSLAALLAVAAGRHVW